MAPALVQQAIGSGSGTSFTVTLGATPAAGSILVLKFRDEVHTGVSVSGGGATWQEIPNFQGSNFGVGWWIGTNVTGSGTAVITYNMTSSATVRLANVQEWSGLSHSPLDKRPTGTSATTASVASVAIIPGRAEGVAFAAFDWNQVAGAPTIGAAGGGYTHDTQVVSGNIVLQGAYRIHSTNASSAYSGTLSASTSIDVISMNLLGPETAPRKAVIIPNPRVGPRVLRRKWTHTQRSKPGGDVAAPASVTGTGGMAFGFSESGTAVETITGTGAWAKGFTESATALETFTSTGGVAFRFAESATAIEKMTGTGSLAFTFAESGTASELIATGTGSLSFGFAESGTAVEKMTAAGSLAFGFTMSGSGSETFTGTGSLAFGFTMSGTAQTGDLASGGVAFTFAESGTGVESIPASGGLAFGFSLAGTALQVQPVAGSGGVAFGFSMDGIAGNTSVVSGGRARAGFITFPEWAKKQRVHSPVNPLLRVEVTPEPVMSQPHMLAEGGVAFGFSEGGEATVNDDELVLLAL